MEYNNMDTNLEDNMYGVSQIENGLQYFHENTDSLGRSIYYISDLHIEFKNEKGFRGYNDCKYAEHVVNGMNGGSEYGDDVLLIVGDVSCYSSQVDFFFKQLRMRRDGIIVFVLGNHELWDWDEKQNRSLAYIVEKYKKICKKHDIILLQNELAIFSDERTQNGEIIKFSNKKVISEDELQKMSLEEIQEYSKEAKLIIYGGVGFSGVCKVKDKNGNIFNADMGLYRDIVPTIYEDVLQSKKCEKGYFKVLEALGDTQVVIMTHSPFDYWCNSKYNPDFIYVSGHTHHNYFERTKECTIFADNQIGYYSDSYELRYFYVDGTYDTFKEYKDGIYKISYKQYIEFNVGKNIQLKKKNDGNQIYMLKKSGYYMFVFYNSRNQLLLLNGGSSVRLNYDIDYYYDNLQFYGDCLNGIIKNHMEFLNRVSRRIKEIGGNGRIHGCIVDIDYYSHVYVNPLDGKIVPYYGLSMDKKYVYESFEKLLEDKCPKLLAGFRKFNDEKNLTNIQVIDSQTVEKVFVGDRSMYSASNVIYNIQYLFYSNVIRNWNDKILKIKNMNTKEAIEEINKSAIFIEKNNKNSSIS